MKQVRLLVVCYWALLIFSIPVGTIIFDTVPPELRASFNALPFPEISAGWIAACTISVIGIVAAFVSSVGLYIGKAWAPRIALYSTATVPVAYMLFPAYLMGTFDQLVSDFSFLLWGALLASAYSPQYREDAANNSLQARRP